MKNFPYFTVLCFVASAILYKFGWSDHFLAGQLCGMGCLSLGSDIANYQFRKILEKEKP